MQFVYKNTQNKRNRILLYRINSMLQTMSLASMKSSLIILIFLSCFFNCSKDEIDVSTKLSSISVKLKSTRGEFDKVFLHIKDVQLKIKEDTNAPNAWISLNAINGGTYNIFDLIADSALLLVDNFEVKPTHIYEIRLVLGENNFIDLEQTIYNLDSTDLGNSNPSNLVNLDLVPNRFYDIIIDINIDKSLSYDEDHNVMVLNPNLYTEIRQLQY